MKVLEGKLVATKGKFAIVGARFNEFIVSKLISGAVGVLFGLLGKLGDRAAINAAADYLGGGVYQVYVEIDGRIVPYVAVDSATGDYHG